MTPYYLCYNPEVILPKSIEASIFGYKRPRFFALVKKIDKSPDAPAIHLTGTNVVFGYSLNGGAPADHMLIVNDNIDKAMPGKLRAALQKAVEWYVRTRALETGAKGVEYNFLHDYHAAVPCLQVLRLEARDEFLVSHAGGITAFASRQATETFLTGTLRLPAAIIENGLTNAEVSSYEHLREIKP